MQRLLALGKQASAGFQYLALENTLARGAALRGVSSSRPANADPVKDSERQPANQFDHATGIEKAEIDAAKKGEDIFHEDWITADFKGTPDDPVVVTSAFEERVVGVPDPEDDCLVVWSLIKKGDPPRQIIAGGEYFVLQQEDAPAWTGIPESFKGDTHH